jgi:outer membrane protein assembly factor BamA
MTAFTLALVIALCGVAPQQAATLHRAEPSEARRDASTADGPVITSFEIRGLRSARVEDVESDLRVRAGDPFDAERLEALSFNLRFLLWNCGYLNPRVDEPVVTPSGSGVSVVLTVSEGVRYRLGAVTIHGQRAFSADELVAVIDVRPGEILDFGKFREGVDRIRELYDSRGYADADAQVVPALPDLTPDGTEAIADVDIDIDEGHVFVMGEVTIKGGTDLDVRMIRASISPREGEPFSYRELDRSVKRINEDRGLALDLPDVDVLKDVKARRVNVVINLNGPEERRLAPKEKEDAPVPEAQPEVKRPTLTRRPGPQ